MNYEKFKWQPLVGAENEIEPLIDVVQMGDGVEQRQAKGLRNYRSSFQNLKFLGEKAEIEEISAFLLRHFLSAFHFEFDGQLFLVRKDGAFKKSAKGAGVYELTVSFVEVVR